MPYFHTKDIHVLYIHVPKTGGTSIEIYFSNKYNIPISATTLCSGKRAFLSVSLQHQTLSTLCSHTDKFNIVLDDSLMILVSVRNPYTRLLSHLYYVKRIRASMSPIQVENVARTYLKQYDTDPHACDNHLLPQHMFVTPTCKYHVLKQESLNADMAALGFNDFKEYENQRVVQGGNVYTQMTMGYIHLVNTYYAEDFLQFNYEMITSEEQLQMLQKT